MEVKRSNGQIFSASTRLSRLPNPRASSSVSRIDNLYGGILARTAPSTWTTIFPYSFYLAGPWLREDSRNLQTFSDYGYNVLHIVPAGGLGYDLAELDAWLDEADRIGLWIMLDMRWSYQVPKNVKILVERVQRHKNLLLWYTADEPGMRIQSIIWLRGRLVLSTSLIFCRWLYRSDQWYKNGLRSYKYLGWLSSGLSLPQLSKFPFQRILLWRRYHPRRPVPHRQQA